MTEKWNGVTVKFDLLPIGTRRTGNKLKTGKPKFAVFHDTGNPNSTAQQNVNYYKNTYNIPWSQVASAHIFVDDKECIICIPVDEIAWHVIYDAPKDNQWYGIDANDGAFGLEASYFTDKERSRKSLDNACRVMAYLCKYWKINPRTNMPGHQQIQSDKIDPGNLLVACGYGRNDMDIIDNKVVAYMSGTKVPLKDKVTQKKPASSKKVSNPRQAPQVKQTSEWRRNSSGVLWKPIQGVFTVTANKGIISRQTGGSRKYPVAEGVELGAKIKFFEMISHDNFMWLAYKSRNGSVAYLPVASSDNKGKATSEYWGKFNT